MSSTRATGRCDTAPPPSRESPTAAASTGVCFAIAEIPSKSSAAIPSRSIPGAVRLLGYLNHTDSGSYADALRLAEQTGTTPDITAVHRAGTLKYGTGVNIEQEISRDVGVFTRLGWNDGKTQDFAFTAIDRLASGGVSVKGAAWKRKEDVAATSFTASGISGVHALYLARGGYDFLIGDGRLNYAPEYLWESYYSARLFPGFFATLRSAALRESGLQPRSRPGLDREHPVAHGIRDSSPARQNRIRRPGTRIAARAAHEV